MRSRFCALVLILLAFGLLPSRAAAHPGSGIVVARDGTVYFVVAGTSRIMRVTREGKATVFVDSEELRLPHHLGFGPDGALYAASDFDGKVWRIAPDGTMRIYFNSNLAPPPAPGRREVWVGSFGDPFTLDSVGNVFALGSAQDSTLVRITPEGTVTALARGTKFGQLHFSSMAFGPDGALYLTDTDRVWRIRGDSAALITPRGATLSRAVGLSVDRDGNIYVADYDERRIVRLSPDGAVNTPTAVARLRLVHPTGVTIAEDGVYVLDNPISQVVVWRVRGDDTELVYRRRGGQIYFQAAFLILVPLVLVLQTWARAPGGRLDWFAWTVPTGTVIVLLYLYAGNAYLFSFARHALLAGFLLGAIRGWKRRTGRTTGA